MEIELKSVLIGAILSTCTTILWDAYKFRRDNKFIYRNRVKHLARLLIESNGQIQLQVKNIEGFVKKLDENKIDVPLLTVSAYHAVDYLAQKVFDEDYYIAYLHVYKNSIDPEDDFFKIRYSSVFISNQFKQIFEMIDKASKNNHERKIEFSNDYRKLFDTIQVISMKNNPDHNAFLKPFYQVFRDYLALNKTTNDITTLYNSVVKKIHSITLEMGERMPIELSDSIIKLDYQYRNIVFQNEALKRDMLTFISPLNNHIELIKEMKKKVNLNNVLLD